MSESTRLTAWRLGIIFGSLLLVETAVRGGWISTFFLAAPPRRARSSCFGNNCCMAMRSR